MRDKRWRKKNIESFKGDNVYTLSYNDIKKSKVLFDFLKDTEQDEIIFPSFPKAPSLKPFIDRLSPYRDFELYDYLDAPEMFDDLAKELNVRNNPKVWAIEKLKPGIAFLVYLYLPLHLVPDDLKSLATEVSRTFMDMWIEKNKDDLYFGEYSYDIRVVENETFLTSFRNNMLDGVKYEWYGDGQVKLYENYINNKLNGRRYQWYENGQLMSEENYVNGKLNGKSYQWYKNGQLRFDINYINNKMNGKAYELYKNGQLMFEDNYIDGKLNGKRYQWHENGQMKIDLNFIDDKLNGKVYEWYENGQLMSEENYIDDNLNGKVYEWYENGDLKSEKLYVNGELVEER